MVNAAAVRSFRQRICRRRDRLKRVQQGAGWPAIGGEAEALLGKAVPALPASLYREYYNNGNRSRYEAPYFARRDAMLTLLMAELAERRELLKGYYGRAAG